MQTLERYGLALSEHPILWGLATCALLVAALPVALKRWRSLPRWLPLAGLVVVCALGIWHAWRLRWIGDDAFISFRYARNLVEGNGLVFNEGAHVEGYTNFLWTMIAASFIGLGLDPAQGALVLSLISLALALVLSTLLVHRLLAGRRPFVLPVAALLLAGNYTFASYGTSGLETMFATLLVLAALQRAEAGDLLGSGLAGIAATLAHPDHSIFYAMLGLTLLLRTRPLTAVPRFFGEARGAGLRVQALRTLKRARWNLLGYALPCILIYVPYFLWRTAYYGDLFPNTYYTKSASEWYFGQGVSYLAISATSGGTWAAIPFLLIGLWRYRRTLSAQYMALVLPVYLLYVAKIGGDFMLGRLLCPLLPLAFSMAELGLHAALSARGRWGKATLAGLPVLALPMVPALVIKPNEKYHFVADERTFYRLKSFDPIEVDCHYTHEARVLNQAFKAALRPPVLGIGCVGIVGYETGMPTFDYWGLTEPSVAKMRIKERGRPGHEKLASFGHAIAGDADFADVPTYPGAYDRHTLLRVGDLTFHLLKYDSLLLEPLRESGALEVEDFEHWLRGWKPPRNQQQLFCDAWFMSEFYFTRNPRKLVRRTGRGALGRLSKKLPDGFSNFVMYGEPPGEAGYREVFRWSFEKPLGADWQLEGKAFSREPVSRERPGQGMVLGNLGNFLTSYHSERGDVATGALRSPSFTVQGDVLSFRLGGGRSSNRLSIKLLVDGHDMRSLSGCGTELLGRWAWDIGAYRGRTAQVVLRDYNTGKWGHIQVDEIVEWARTDESAGAPRHRAQKDERSLE